MPLQPGDVLDGRYEIEERLGAGGMGEVFKATHKYLGSPRVIKVVHSQIAGSTDAHDRFLREARAATRVQHPNVATVHDFSSLPDGAHYMAWEFIEGENLAQRLRSSGPLPPRAAIRIAVQALHGLDAIHRAGIIHRDISPENLMITAGTNVKIIDLGVAKLEDPEATSQTRAGMFVGKLRYASPEQLGLLADSDRIDGRADLYSLAVVLVEMLTGRPPYDAKSPHEYFVLHTTEPERMKTVELPAEMPGREELERILRKALARRRDDRYATALDFARELEEAERHLPAADAPTIAVPFVADETLRVKKGGTFERDTLVTPQPAASTVRTPLPSPVPAAPSRKTSVLLISAAVVTAALLLAAGATGVALLSKRNAADRGDRRSAPVPAGTSGSAGVSGTEATVTAASERSLPAIQTAEGSSVATTAAPSAAPAATDTPSVARPVTRPVAATSSVRESASESRQPAAQQKENEENSKPPSEARDEAPALALSGTRYVDGGDDGETNDRLLAELRSHVKGVTRVSIQAGAMQQDLVNAMKEYIPTLDVSDSAAVSIRFDGTFERLGFGRKRRAATATVSKNGRVIFRYELPDIVYRVGMTPPEAFARVLSDAFLE